MATWFLGVLHSQLIVSLPYPDTDFSGQTIIVTGANTGLGFEAAKHLVHLKASRVILAVRNLEKGQAAKAAIESSTQLQPRTLIEVWQLDLASSKSVKEFAHQVGKLERLDVLLENAGMMTSSFKMVEGDETMLKVNVISTELLALLVLPKLRETASRFNVEPRLSIVTSNIHFITKFPERDAVDIFGALNNEGKTDMRDRYQLTKLLEIFFIRELGDRISASAKPKVIVNCMTPGICQSEFDRETTGWKKKVGTVLAFLVARSAEVGSRALVASVAAGQESHGGYMADCVVSSPSPLVLSDEGKELQGRLWEQTIKKLEAIQPGIGQLV